MQIIERRIVICSRDELVIRKIVAHIAVPALVQVVLMRWVSFLRLAAVDRLLNRQPPEVMSREFALEDRRILTQSRANRSERHQHVV